MGQNATKNLSSNFKSATKFHGISKIIIKKKIANIGIRNKLIQRGNYCNNESYWLEIFQAIVL